MSLKCLDCIHCVDCNGLGVFDENAPDKLQGDTSGPAIAQTFATQPVITIPPDSDIPPLNMVHPHLLAALVPEYPVKEPSEYSRVIH